MSIDFGHFDKRHYPTLGVREGYREWSPHYEDTVLDLMDLRLLERLSVDWSAAGTILDMACGTGRTGAWLKSRGAGRLTGLDLTDAMLERARARGAHDALVLGDAADTGFADASFDLVTLSLADEHFPTLDPFYREAARVLKTDGRLVLAGFHPFFAMLGMPTHFNRESGEAVAIETHIHLMSDHVAAAHAAGFSLREMTDGLIDDDWIAAKPKWAAYRNHPISFAFVWVKL